MADGAKDKGGKRRGASLFDRPSSGPFADLPGVPGSPPQAKPSEPRGSVPPRPAPRPAERTAVPRAPSVGPRLGSVPPAPERSGVPSPPPRPTSSRPPRLPPELAGPPGPERTIPPRPAGSIPPRPSGSIPPKPERSIPPQPVHGASSPSRVPRLSVPPSSARSVPPPPGRASSETPTPRPLRPPRMAPSLSKSQPGPLLPPAAAGGPVPTAIPRRPSFAAAAGAQASVPSEPPRLGPPPKAPTSIPPLRIRIPGPDDSVPPRAVPHGETGFSLLPVDGDFDEPSFPDADRPGHFDEPPPPTEERATDPGFLAGDGPPPPILSMPGSHLRTLLATPVEVAIEDDPPPPPPLGGSPLLARAAGGAPPGGLLARARAAQTPTPWDAHPVDSWGEGRPSGPFAPPMEDGMRLGGRISSPDSPAMQPGRPSLATDSRGGRVSVHDLEKEAAKRENQRRMALLVLLLAMSLLFLINAQPGLLKGEMPEMKLPELSFQAFFPPTSQPTAEVEEPPAEGSVEPDAGTPAPPVEVEVPEPAPPPTITPDPPKETPTAPPKADTTPEPGASTPKATPGPTPYSPFIEDQIREREDSIGILVVRSQPQAVIYLNGRKLGLTPINRHELKPGSYTVKAVVSGRPAQTKWVRIDGSKPKELQFDFTP